MHGHGHPWCFWNFIPEQVQNPDKLVGYLEAVCCHPGNSRKTQISATYWGLAHAYRALFNTIQCSKPEGGKTRMTGTAASPDPQLALQPLRPAPRLLLAPSHRCHPTRDAAAAATTAAAAPALVTDTVAEPENQPMPVSLTPVQKKKDVKKSDRPVRDDNEPGPSQEQEKEAEPEIIIQSLCQSEQRDMRKDFSLHPGKHVVTWLSQCWDNWASNLESEGREAKQLGSLAREGGTDKAIGK